MALRNPNPMLSRSFQAQTAGRDGTATAKAMTLEGTVHKSAALLFALVAAAGFVYVGPVTLVAAVRAVFFPILIVAFVVALLVTRRPHLAKPLGFAYAVLEGLVLGMLSRILDDAYPGIAQQALVLTVSVAAVTFGAYRFRVVRATENFKAVVLAATIGVAVAYLFSLVGALFGLELPLLHENSLGGIAFSLFVVVLAAANLVLDFDFVEKGIDSGMDGQYEWVAAFGLMVTLVWLYLELLRLLSKLSSRD